MTTLFARIGCSPIRAVACLSLASAIWGCSKATPARTDTPATQASSASYDGRYAGTVRVAGAGSGINEQVCATNPTIEFEVKNNRFVYVQPHPNVAGTAVDLTKQSTTVTYDATIAPDGIIRADGGEVGGMMSGQVTGTHMAGQINGEVCYYTFTADRM